MHPAALTSALRGGGWATLRRFGLVTVPSAVVSAAHLLVQVVAIAHFDARGIGTLTFMLTLIQFGFGLSNALVCAPYSVLANRAGDADADATGAVAAVNLLLAVAYGFVCLGAAMALGAGWAAAAFGVAPALLLVRWFARTDAYARHVPNKAAVSDLVYALVLAAWITAGTLTRVTLPFVAAGFVVAALAGLVPFGPATRRLLRGAGRLANYGSVWRSQSSWALVGVATTEATGNGHSYLVTALLGPAAFAPLAVGGLFLRPLNVCLVALTQAERPRLARDLDRGQVGAALASVRHFLIALLVVWVVTLVGAAAAIAFAPHLVMPRALDRGTVVTTVALTGAIALVQCLATPRSVLLQAADRFRVLAVASALSCGLTIAAVLLLLLTLPAVWSLAGVMLGQVAMLAGIEVAARRWRGEAIEGQAKVLPGV